MSLHKFIHLFIPLGVGIIITLFWGIGYQEILPFHEQNQLFLFTTDYLKERIVVAGGLADWLSEFIVQFFFYPWVGAILISVLMMAMQQVTYLLSFHMGGKQRSKSCDLALSFIPVLLCLCVMGDHDTLLSYPTALLMTLVASLALLKTKSYLCQLLFIPVVYWMVGPVAVIYGCTMVIESFKATQNGSIYKAILKCLGIVTLSVLTFYYCRMWWMAQYPWATVLAGINYHRTTLLAADAPAILSTVPWLISGALLFRAIVHQHKMVFSMPVWVITVYIGCTVHNYYDPNICALLKENQWVRKGDWKTVTDHIEQWRADGLAMVTDPISMTAQNLSLGMQGRMAEMFQYPQKAQLGLLLPWKKDNFSNISTMEAFWQLGFVNEALRYAFDIQESIPNCRKSGRYISRMAECNIVNGRYDVARKYIDILKHSLFYADWAQRAETLLDNEESINNHPIYSRKRQIRLTNDFLYYYAELDKMLGQLYLSNRSNQLAYDYFMGCLLLQGKKQEFLSCLPQKPQPGSNPFPAGYSDYCKYIQDHAQEIFNTDASSGASTIAR